MAKIAERRGRLVIDFYDNTGKRRWVTMPKGSTKKAAREKLREIEDQLARGVWMPEKKIPTFKTVGQDWLEQKALNVRASTLEMYRGHLENHFTDIDPIRVNRISIATVEKFITKKRNVGMNLTTLRKLIVTFNQVMQYAVRHRYIEFNPVRDAERPRNRGEETKPKIRVLCPEEINRFLDAVETDKYRMLFHLAIMSGARQGELLGLKWSDIKWDALQIHIQRTFNTNAFYKPKTATSNRRIDIGPATMAALKQWRTNCPESDHNLVFPNRSGQPINQSNMLSRRFFPALEKAGVRRIRFHDLRHTYASMLIDQGENIKYIQTQLGHSSPTVTLDVYTHLLKPMNQGAALKLETTIKAAVDETETKAGANLPGNVISFPTGSKTVAESKKGHGEKAITP